MDDSSRIAMKRIGDKFPGDINEVLLPKLFMFLRERLPSKTTAKIGIYTLKY